MENEKRLIDADRRTIATALKMIHDVDFTPGVYEHSIYGKAALLLEKDAVEVVHGRWEKCGGDLHSSGYAVYCSVCNKTHFVHYEYSLGGLYGHKELFEKPKYCPSCGAVMDGEI